VANLAFDGNDLSTYATTTLDTPGLKGAHDLVGQKTKSVEIPGRAVVDEVVVRRPMRTIVAKCVTDGTDHATLVANLGSLKAAVSPELGWCALTVTDRPSKRIMARCEGFPIDIQTLPYVQTVVEFKLTFRAYPYWEDSTETTTAVTGTSGSVSNGGDLETPPTFEITCNAAFGSGITVDIGGDTFTYESSLASGDFLVVDTESFEVTKNGSGAISGVATGSAFPALAAGSNTVTKSSSDFDLDVKYRQRYE